MNNKIISIIGGTGQMGQLFAKLWQDIGFTVHTLGSKTWDEAPQKLANSDAVIVCVPINFTDEIIAKTAQYISPTTILADFTSLKVTPIMSMLKYHTGAVVGLHPMFGPTIHSPHNQIIVNCEGRFPEQCSWLIDSLIQLDFTVKTMRATDHDMAMNFIQGIEHFLTFSLGTFLFEKQQHPEKLLEVASPIYLAKLLLMGRIFDQDPVLYADIIMADPQRIILIKEFADWLTTWVNKIEQYNKQDFINEFKKASSWMGEFTSYAQKISDNFLTIDLDKYAKKTSYYSNNYIGRITRIHWHTHS